MSSTREAVERKDYDLAYSIVEQMGLGFEFRHCSCGQLPCARLRPIVDALDQREREVRERLIRVLGIKEVEDLAYHAIGVWQAFEESSLFNNSVENGQRIRDAVEGARQIAATAAAIRRDSAQEQQQEKKQTIFTVGNQDCV